MGNFLFDFAPGILPQLLQGAVVSLEITVCAMVGAIAIGVVAALCRLSSVPPLRGLIYWYVEIARGIPALVILLFTYFSLPTVGIWLPAFWAGVLGLSVSVGAYLSETFRASILAVPDGQREAANALGLNRLQTFVLVVLPQALVIALPTTGGYFIGLLKDSALVSYISVNELLREGNEIISSTFRTMEVYTVVGILYFVMSYVASRFFLTAERRLTPLYMRAQAAQTRRTTPPQDPAILGESPLASADSRIPPVQKDVDHVE